jgi:hypothetical protein
MSGSVEPVSLCAQAGKLVLVAGVRQPALRVSIGRVGLGNHGVSGDRLLPIPGIGSGGRLRIVQGQLLLAARQLQLPGGVARSATESFAQQVDGLIPLLCPGVGPERRNCSKGSMSFGLAPITLLIAFMRAFRCRRSSPLRSWTRPAITRTDASI